MQEPTETDIIIFTVGSDVWNLRSIWAFRAQDGVKMIKEEREAFFCNYKVHGHGDQSRDEGDGMTEASEYHPYLHFQWFNERAREGSVWICI